MKMLPIHYEIAATAATGLVGTIANAYTNIAQYKMESKRIQGQIESIRLQASVFHKQIDQQTMLQLKQLEQQNKVLEASFHAMMGGLGDLSVSKKQVLRMQEGLMAEFHKIPDVQSKMACKEMMAILKDQYIQMEDQTTQKLAHLCQQVAVLPSPSQQTLAIGGFIQ
jgi:hypothetical protein